MSDRIRVLRPQTGFWPARNFARMLREWAGAQERRTERIKVAGKLEPSCPAIQGRRSG